jgi:hypothetical protein
MPRIDVIPAGRRTLCALSDSAALFPVRRFICRSAGSKSGVAVHAELPFHLSTNRLGMRKAGPTRMAYACHRLHLIDSKTGRMPGPRNNKRCKADESIRFF